MLAKRIVACLDVRDGRVVKGSQFHNLREIGDPAACARRYCDQGIDELVILDVSATLESRIACLNTIEQVSRVIDVPLTVGGGVRGESDAIRLLDAGADKIALNSAAVADPNRIHRLSQRYGAQCVVLSIDTRKLEQRYELTTHSAEISIAGDPVDWARQAQDLGAGEILLTSIDRDGTRSGFDLDLIRAFTRALNIPVVASGGACDAASFAKAFEAGADAALGASVFHDGDVTVADVKRCCIEHGLEIRP